MFRHPQAQSSGGKLNGKSCTCHGLFASRLSSQIFSFDATSLHVTAFHFIALHVILYASSYISSFDCYLIPSHFPFGECCRLVLVWVCKTSMSLPKPIIKSTETTHKHDEHVCVFNPPWFHNQTFNGN